MGSKPASAPRAEREDTKTLLRLGADRDSARLPSEQREVLRDIAKEGDAAGNRVLLWFKGLQAPVRARVRINGERIRLETLLPFLELDSEVEIARSEEGARLHARIAQVTLTASVEQPVPRLSVEVALARSENGPKLDAASAAKPEAGAVAPPSSTPAQQASSASASASGHGSRWLPWLAAFVLGVAGGAAGTGAWLAPWLRAPFAAPVHRSDVQHTRPETPRELQPPVAVEAAAAPLPAAVIAPIAAADAPSAPVELQPTLEAAPAAVAVPFAAPEPEPEPEAEPEPAIATAIEAAPTELAPARGLEIDSANGQTEIFVPMQGSADGMERYALTTPGVSYTLPHARALIASSNYVVAHRPLVRRVWLRDHDSGVQVRIILPRASIHDEARFDADGLHVVLRP